MLFKSYVFIFAFLPITFFVYFYFNSKRLTEASKAFLVLSSLFFYSWWNIAYLPIILTSILFNYVIGNSLNENFKNVQLHKKALLTFGIIANVVLLGVKMNIVLAWFITIVMFFNNRLLKYSRRSELLL